MTDILDRAKAALEGITPGPWTHHVSTPEDTGESHAQWQANTLIGDGEPLHVLTAATDDDRYAYIVPAITGDGPTSARNADFIASARGLMPELVDEVEQLRAHVNVARAVVDSWRSSTATDSVRADFIRELDAALNPPPAPVDPDVVDYAGSDQ